MIGRRLAARRTAVRILLGLAVAALALSACGGESEAPVNRYPHTGTGTATAGPDGVQQITLDANDDYRFHPSTIIVHPGRVRITLVNMGHGAPHNFEVLGNPSDYVPNVGAGGSASVTFVAPAVSASPYQFVCTLHTKQGMTGEMFVRQ